MDELIKHINSVIDINENEEIEKTTRDEMSIYEINYAYINDIKLSRILNEQEMTLEKIDLVKKIKNESNEDDKVKMELKVEELQKKIEIENERINEATNDIKLIDDIYITFVDPKTAAYFFKLYNKNVFTRCCLICCCERKKIQPF